MYYIYFINMTISNDTANSPTQRNGVKSGTRLSSLNMIENTAIAELETIILIFGLLLNIVKDIYDIKNITINSRFPNIWNIYSSFTLCESGKSPLALTAVILYHAIL